MPKCKSCGKVIGFIKTENNKTMPIEPGVKKFINRDGVLLEEFEPHWQYCAGADRHRKRKGKNNGKF